MDLLEPLLVAELAALVDRLLVGAVGLARQLGEFARTRSTSRS